MTAESLLRFRAEVTAVSRPVWHRAALTMRVLLVVVRRWNAARATATVDHWSRETQQRQRLRAQAIAEQFGDGVQDFFKSYADKNLFFTANGSCFVGYRVANGVAVALGTAVGPKQQEQGALREFVAFCRTHHWRAAFHQVSADALPAFGALGFRRMKVGEDAIVELADFTIQGKRGKELRNTVAKLERASYTVERWDPPIATGKLAKLKAISDEWLTLPGRRERRFTLGEFEPAYVSATPIYVACDAAGDPVAFLNLAPTYRRDEAAVDLMRRRHTAPNGIIDYLFTKAFLDLKARGHARVHLGMAPLNGFHAGEQSNWEERLVHAVLTRFDRIFSFEGLRSFKAKYATRWEPRYAVYRSALDLPRFGMALRRVTEHEAA